MVNRLLRICIVVCCLASCTAELFADSFPQGRIVRAEHLRLRNLDPSGDTPLYAAKWRLLADQMYQLFLRNASSMPFRDRIFAAETHLRVSQNGQLKEYLLRAKEIAAGALADGATESPDYSEALVLRGDIGVALHEPQEVVRDLYQRAVLAMPKAAWRAKHRLNSLEHGTFDKLVPCDDLEVPRVVVDRQDQASHKVKRRIILDPGHGGFDGGAAAVGGALVEKDITLDIAKRVKSILEADPTVSVLLTRDHDQFVSLARRTAFANRRMGDLFVSIHLNASPSHAVQGLESYYLNLDGDEASRRLAERENGIPAGGDMDDLSFILSDLIQSGKLEDSVELSSHLQGAVLHASKKGYAAARDHGVKKGPFYVLVGAHMPCTLIELFFIDHPQDGAKLASESFRSILAQGLSDGIMGFVSGAPIQRGNR